jgi:uncharacterized membrane protein
MKKFSITSSFATAALAVAMSAPVGAAESPAGSHGAAIGAGDKVHCYGVHSCKGNSDCKTAEHACKGQNKCGGHGFKGMKAKDCLAAGGVISDVKS